jgi:hypothetical protein
VDDVVLAHAGRHRPLVDDAAGVLDRLGQAEQVGPRLELRLVVEPDRARHRIGQRGVLHERDVQAGVARGGRLLLQVAEVLGRFRVGVGRPAPQRAVDPELPRPGHDLVEPGLLSGGVLARAALAELAAQLGVDPPVQGGDLRRGVTGDAGADGCGPRAP